MAIDQDLAAKGFRKLLILVGLLIASPLLLTVSFKALKLYKEGSLFYISIAGVVLSSILIFFTLYFAFKTFKILLDALFSDS
ncbi:DUF6095 family protein [bacterium]|jgi:hypothetical protein|nr:hypothetical protein [Flavobacterium sp.]MDA9295266.1 DUF6095 family protein [bacterium]MDA9327514.1 DUF6095 family protein [Flavobacteriaceae bacterium]MDA9337802.1 DUF6095 family protein [Flavobacteriaceae bacterium]MDB4065099.1 DUF6095 family protein [Flavobacteriaceae bacterium]|tara:strand:- start:1803 stop:2048 length:246 start_codon:yes stop_codon:yes gene_type:complete